MVKCGCVDNGSPSVICGRASRTGGASEWGSSVAESGGSESLLSETGVGEVRMYFVHGIVMGYQDYSEVQRLLKG